MRRSPRLKSREAIPALAPASAPAPVPTPAAPPALLGAASVSRQPPSSERPGRDDRELHRGDREQEEDDRGREAERGPPPVRPQASPHRPHRLGDDRDRDQLERVQPCRLAVPPECEAEGEEGHEDRGRRGEAEPGHCRARVSRAEVADRETGLAARRPGQELAEGDEVRVGRLVEPAPPGDELAVEDREVGGRPPEGGEAEPQEYAEYASRAQIDTPSQGSRTVCPPVRLRRRGAGGGGARNFALRNRPATA